MASYTPTAVLLLFLTCLPGTILSQKPSTGISPSVPTIAECGPALLPLASCAAFVQGTAPSPPQPCCDSLKQLYNQQAGCLCLLLNDTTLSSFPINNTLAMQLPLVCDPQVDISACSGVSSPSISPPQFSLETKVNSTVAASPVVTIAPRPTVMGFRFPQSAGMNLRTDGHLVVLVVLAAMAFMLTDIVYVYY
ncbi:hypothetical protein RJ639_038627 [Escallonia herrerae]|uniref:Bifunctional inhibitor/plant lipid transfer protein/seed storage helical domain-containing protein n=1 Tax=Escallonia herrerae TaxID=1293975 RepID=A0AA89AGS5_9ASTE|nr:hypothetical protein RJ639_025102 [Escallonia herrerae]KAK3001888.1 hypothetical protein RJ639_021010 [Escallonia herrerae]KAK3028054.1 hypothetical protein RJ639_038627 [Escallonia herrerae]